MTLQNHSAVPHGFASVMVGVHSGLNAEGPIRIAASIAGDFGSRLIGVAAQDIMIPYFEEGSNAVEDVIIENAEGDVLRALARAETVFRRSTGTSNATEWRSATLDQHSYFLAQARACDLFVIGRQGPDDPKSGRSSASPADLLIGLGRPMLVVPPRVDHLSAKRVVVAWKDTREARRAVHDALPLLRRAELVWVGSFGDDIDTECIDDVCDYLRLHRIAARPVIRCDVPNPAEGIVDLALEERADLIVSGAYGHSRLREWFLGGVTKELLDHTPVCCLMSH